MTGPIVRIAWCTAPSLVVSSPQESGLIVGVTMSFVAGAFRRVQFVIAVVALAASLASCSSEAQNGVDSLGTSDDLSDLASVDPTNLGINAAISGCGGFLGGSEEQRWAVGEMGAKSDDPVEEQCSEGLEWSFDEASSTVTFTHKNLRLNCCGSHSITVTPTGSPNGFEIAELDAPDADGRCRCMCMYDFVIDLPNVSGVVNVKLTLMIEDEAESPQAAVRWEGAIDLTAGSGAILIQQRSGDACW